MQPNPNTIYGSFYFMQANSGSLAGRYLEHREPTPYQENAQMTSLPGAENWTGTYATTWEEAGQEVNYSAQLIIRQINLVFHLEWTNIQGGIEFERYSYHGAGFLQQNVLIGSYWRV